MGYMGFVWVRGGVWVGVGWDWGEGGKGWGWVRIGSMKGGWGVRGYSCWGWRGKMGKGGRVLRVMGVC